MDQSPLLNVVRRRSDGNVWKGDVWSRFGDCDACGSRLRRRDARGRRHLHANPASRCTAGTREPVGSKRVAWAAVALRPVAAYRSPGGAAIRRFGVRNANGAPTVFGVLARQLDVHCRTTWLHVALPIRPNGASGWIRASAVREQQVRTRITVDLSARRLRLYRNAGSSSHARGRDRLARDADAARPVLREPAADPRAIRTGPSARARVGISAFSPVLTGWTQGGPIAIHGTNEPWSIGHAVSNGCIRLPERGTLRRAVSRARGRGHAGRDRGARGQGAPTSSAAPRRAAPSGSGARSRARPRGSPRPHRAPRAARAPSATRRASGSTCGRRRRGRRDRGARTARRERHGMRNPRCSYSGLTSGPAGGGTWSKKPPHSSNVKMSSVRGHAGLRTTAL